jgi:hypothetical protein
MIKLIIGRNELSQRKIAMVASNRTETLSLVDAPAVGVHLEGKTGVKLATNGRFAVVSLTPNRDGSLRLIKSFADRDHARRYNFAIHGDKL